MFIRYLTFNVQIEFLDFMSGLKYYPLSRVLLKHYINIL
ncbi:hypothetical protein GAGA_4066 [Paraglaciecola agarilytica NO2]|uniref:Uncharacterized protein n=1 Tax=Paraglaciecola agarilytica NO2 TaxID=1125747 RepID=A0ABQ0ICY4_9ALTE|nr:hypothetical protein GAGA_4066 [Paraglaciecola agarilytica NO2]